MIKQQYKDMLEVMKLRGGPYVGLDIPEFYDLVQELFTEEEALVNNVLSKKPTTAEDAAKKLNMGVNEATIILEKMVDKGLCGTSIENGIHLYNGLPFMPGIFEYIYLSGGKTDRDKKIALLIRIYQKAYESIKGKEKIKFPLNRVITVDKKIRADNVIHTYDQVKSFIDKYDTIGVGSCYCRHTALLRGEDIHEMPIEVCMWFGKMAKNIIDRLGGRELSKSQALEILDQCEKAGLLHMSRNTTDDIDFLCNCDRWHCEVVTNMLNQPKPGKLFNSGFQPSFNKELCIACETCIEQCPPQALTLGNNNIPEVNLDRCFGCGVCATGCEQEAITMEAKNDFPVPPKNLSELITSLKKTSAGKH